MNLITVFSYPSQKQRLILPDGSSVSIQLAFKPMQYGWFFQSIEWQDFSLKGVRVVNSPNILNQFRNKIPFGLACYSTQNREPTLQEDFSSKSSTLYLLNEADVAEVTEFLRG